LLTFLQVGITAVGNAFQSYRTVYYARRIYSGPVPSSGSVSINTTGIVATTEIVTTIEESASPTEERRPSVTTRATAASSISPATPLSARTFGTWNAAVGVARLYAAYNIHNEAWYQMSTWTNIIGLIHFGLEIFVYETCKPTGPVLAPLITASIGLIWHLMQYNHYVK
jgi:Erg28 like protein